MKYFIVALLALGLVGCGHNLTNYTYTQKTFIRCTAPNKPPVSQLDREQHLGSKDNSFALVENYINMATYIKELEHTLNCFNHVVEELE